MAKAPSGVESLDFETMSDQELRDVMQRAKEALNVRVTSRMEEFRQLARDAGFVVTLTKIGEEASRRGRRRSQEGTEGEDRRHEVPPKYRNPDNSAETWAGRGRKPKWVEEKLAQGRTLDDLLISQPGAAENASSDG
jgi:DNA-binding protein H-NS